MLWQIQGLEDVFDTILEEVILAAREAAEAYMEVRITMSVNDDKPAQVYRIEIGSGEGFIDPRLLLP